MLVSGVNERSQETKFNLSPIFGLLPTAREGSVFRGEYR